MDVLTHDQIAAATANMPTGTVMREEARKADLESFTYGRELKSEKFQSVLGPDGKIAMSGYDSNGERIPRYNLSDKDQTVYVKGADGLRAKAVIKPGEQYVDRKGQKQYEPLKYVLVNADGARIELHESIVKALAASTETDDVALFNTLTGDGAHAPVFTGALAIRVVLEDVPGATWKRPVLKEG